MELIIKSDFGFSTTFEIVKILQRAIEETLEDVNKLAISDTSCRHRFDSELISVSLSSVENQPYKMERVGYSVKSSLFIDNDGKFVEFSQGLCDEMFSLVGTISKGRDEKSGDIVYVHKGLQNLYNDMCAYIRHVYKEEVLVYAQRNLKDFC